MNLLSPDRRIWRREWKPKTEAVMSTVKCRVQIRRGCTRVEIGGGTRAVVYQQNDHIVLPPLTAEHYRRLRGWLQDTRAMDAFLGRAEARAGPVIRGSVRRLPQPVRGDNGEATAAVFVNAPCWKPSPSVTKQRPQTYVGSTSRRTAVGDHIWWISEVAQIPRTLSRRELSAQERADTAAAPADIWRESLVR